MKVFVTGASGFVGSAVVRELIEAGHEVLGLARNPEATAKLVELGATAFLGSIEDAESLGRAVGMADGVIHIAFNHDFSRFRENCEADRQVIGVLGNALSGSGRPLVVTSAIGVLPPGALVSEDTPPVSEAINPRAASEEAAERVATLNVPVSVVRLAPSVHGEGDHAFVPTLIRIARQTGVSVYGGDGANRWPGVHRLDAAHLFRLALEKAAPFARYHAVAEEGIAFRAIAEAIGKGLGLPVEARGREEAVRHFGWFAHFASMDVCASSALTRAQLDWAPRELDLIADLESGTYFKNPAA